MNNIIRAVFNPGDDTTKAYGIHQWNYGQRLEIHGLDLPRAVEVHFAAVDDTEAIVRIGTTADKVTTVPIPDVFFEQEMDIKAYVYLSDSQSGETIKTINMPMTPRQKPEGWNGSEETTMGAIMDAINQFADGKADGLECKDNILKLMSGENELARVTIAGGAGGTAREIELQKSDTAIQWRYVGEEDWRDLVLLEELRGNPGKDGISPTATVTKEGKVTTINITDKNGTTTETIQDGQDGYTPKKGVDYTDGLDGKTAYQYAQDGGYSGTEEEFAEKLAEEYPRDVQIDGSSIVTDGVANISVGCRKLGVVLIPDTSTNRHIYIEEYSGKVKIGLKTEDEILNRKIVQKVLAGGTEDAIVKVAMTDGIGPAWTDEEKTGAWSRLNSIKNTMDEVAVAGASYILGELTELSVTLPDDALVGQEISVVWYNGDTPAALSITGNILDYDYTPTSNTRSEISALWDGTNWSVIGMSQDVQAETSKEVVE